MSDRKKKFVVWLHNYTDRRDDEWKVVWAMDAVAAKKTYFSYDESRFSRGEVMTAATFRRRMGIKP